MAKSSVKLLLLAAVCFCSFISAQSPSRVVFRHLGKMDGLSQTSVFASAQDSTGFLWFATRDGLNRFDGFDFEVYRSDGTRRGPAGNDVRSLYVDPLTKMLWVGTLEGLSRYDPAADAFHNYKHLPDSGQSLPGNIIQCVFRDQRGWLWVGTSLGLARFDEDNDTFDQYFPGKGKSDIGGNDIRFIVDHPNGGLLLGTANGMFLLSGDRKEEYRRIDAFNGLSLTCAAWDKQGVLFAGTDKRGVIRWSPDAGVLGSIANDESSAASLSHNSVRTLAFTPAGDLWVGTFYGLNLLRSGQATVSRFISKQPDIGSLQDNSIRSLLVDDVGSLWVGTYYGGIHHLDERYNNFVNYRYDGSTNSLSGKVVSSFAQEPSGNFWLGTEGGGLNYFNTRTDQFRRYGPPAGEPGAVTGNNVKALLLDDETLWIGNFRAGLTRLNTATGAFSRYRHSPQNPNTIAHDNVYGFRRQDDLLWILTYGGGLDVLNVSSGRIRHFPHNPQDSLSIDSDLTRSILKTTAGSWWIGTDNGLNLVTTGDDGYPIRFDRRLKGVKVYVIREGKEGTLWLGTFRNGLIKFNPLTGEEKRYSSVNGLPDNAVFGIIPAEDGTMWLSTGNGLSRFNPTDENFINYDSSNGLENLEYNFNAYYQSSDGAFMFGGINGFTRLYPHKIKANKYIPQVAFTNLYHNGQTVKAGERNDLLKQSLNDTKRLTFPYNEARFTLSFAALDYFSPENNYYAYKLEGLDRSWTYARGINEATYTIQREGEYTFLLKAGNSDGVWSDQVRKLTIVVNPPAWRSWWAYSLYILLSGLLLSAATYFIRLRHKIQIQEIARRQQEELLEAKLRFFTNITHEFRTPLTLILGPLRQMVSTAEHSPETARKLDLIKRNAQRLLELVNQVLSFRKLVADHEPMKVRKLAISPFLSDIFNSFRERARSRNITYTLKDTTQATEAWVDPGKLEKVFYNLLSNAFKFTPDGGSIQMNVRRLNNHLEILVADSGIGVEPALKSEIFERFYERSMGQQTSSQSSGIGLALSRQMVRLHRGRLYVKDNGAGSQGAVFVVELPLDDTLYNPTDIGEQTSPEVTTAMRGTDTAPSDDLPGTTGAATQTVAGNRGTLLLVDDNPDIREYLSDIFRDDFKILTAPSGLSGLEVAMEQSPDLIISDVMMPEMDGLAFCSAVKTNLSVSHIPVILLTARTAQPSRIEGLKTGADDYVTKPFHAEELRLRVTNLLANRKRFRESFANSLDLEPSRLDVTSLDEQFLRDALAIAERHVEDPRYKVDDFARDMAVSRTLLFTKIKALTGQTPSKFLKTFRLKRAAQLLTDSDYRISKIANQAGFRDERYFAECFKRHFGVTPTAYRKGELKD